MKLRSLCLGIAAALFSLPLAAANIVTVTPSEGFPWGGNAVLIETSIPLVEDSVRCDPSSSCRCPATVTIGGVSAQVVQVARLGITVIAPPHAPGLVDVQAHVDGVSELSKPRAFFYRSDFVAPSADYVRMLVPLLAYDLHGAGGSLWRSELTLLNDSNYPVTLVPEAEYAPHRAVQVRLAPRPNGLDGAFVYVPRDLGDAFAMQLRARDVSKEAEGWGTEVPVVSEHEFSQVLQLLDVPADPRYRATLRIYGDPGLERVHVSTYVLGDREEPIDERTVTLQSGDEGTLGFAQHPPYAQLDPLTPAVREAAQGQPVRIRVLAEPPEEGDFVAAPRAWAFVSITNNETQQVTTVTPQQ